MKIIVDPALVIVSANFRRPLAATGPRAGILCAREKNERSMGMSNMSRCLVLGSSPFRCCCCCCLPLAYQSLTTISKPPVSLASCRSQPLIEFDSRLENQAREMLARLLNMRQRRSYQKERESISFRARLARQKCCARKKDLTLVKAGECFHFALIEK